MLKSIIRLRLIVLASCITIFGIKRRRIQDNVRIPKIFFFKAWPSVQIILYVLYNIYKGLYEYISMTEKTTVYYNNMTCVCVYYDIVGTYT